MCDAFGMGIGVHSQGELGVGMAAMLHLASTLPTLVHAMDAHYHHLTDDIIVGGPLAIHDGQMRVPTGPGLGVELDRERLGHYADLFRETAEQRVGRAPDPERADWIPTYPAW
jgi:glucarate dehydratase